MTVQVMDMLEQMTNRKKAGANSWKSTSTNLTSKWLTLTNSLHRVILLVDSTIGLQDSDKMLVNMLTETHRPFMIVLTKADKVNDTQLETAMNTVADEMKSMGALCNPNIHAVSAYNGYGMYELLSNLVFLLDFPILRKPTLF